MLCRNHCWQILNLYIRVYMPFADCTLLRSRGGGGHIPEGTSAHNNLMMRRAGLSTVIVLGHTELMSDIRQKSLHIHIHIVSVLQTKLWRYCEMLLETIDMCSSVRPKKRYIRRLGFANILNACAFYCGPFLGFAWGRCCV